MYASVQNLLQKVSRKLDGVAMYRTVSLALVFIAVCSIMLGFLGFIPYTGLEQIISLSVALLIAFLVNFLCSSLWRVNANHESALITALILFFLVIPAQVSDLTDSWVIAAVVALGVLSKYIVAWRKQHLLNPAAFGAVALAFIYLLYPDLGYFETSWWVGQIELFIPLSIAGLVVVKKVRKWELVSVFLGVAFLVFLFEEWKFSGDAFGSWSNFWFSGPSLFLAFFMLTEPFTMPPTKKLQVSYAAIIGFISQTTLFLPFLKMTPELALLLGNIIFYPATLRQKLVLGFVASREIAKNTYEFIFTKPHGLKFKAGQYLEWMLPHEGADNRGIRRYFTIASAPSEDEFRIGVRFGSSISSYKTTLKELQMPQTIIASQLAGDFTLPRDVTKKIAYIAGGIGITPFISQLIEMHRSQTKYDTVLFNCNSGVAEIAYFDRLKAFTYTLPFKMVNVLANENLPGFAHGYLTKEIISAEAPDYLERYWYLSGPPAMVNAYHKLLIELGVPRKEIVLDFFPGLA